MVSKKWQIRIGVVCYCSCPHSFADRHLTLQPITGIWASTVPQLRSRSLPNFTRRCLAPTIILRHRVHDSTVERRSVAIKLFENQFVQLENTPLWPNYSKCVLRRETTPSVQSFGVLKGVSRENILSDMSRDHNNDWIWFYFQTTYKGKNYKHFIS